MTFCSFVSLLCIFVFVFVCFFAPSDNKDKIGRDDQPKLSFVLQSNIDCLHREFKLLFYTLPSH